MSDEGSNQDGVPSASQRIDPIPGRILDLKRSREGEVEVIALSGELDLSSAELLEAAVTEAVSGDAEVLQLDLRELEFCDSTGLAAIIASVRRCHAASKRLSARRPQSQVQKLFALTGVEASLSFDD